MSFLADLDGELTKVGIPRRRRTRIVTEFSDHLSQDPAADLGEPQALARQFADELGTRLARETALWAFAVLAVGAGVLTDAFFDGGRLWAGWIGYGNDKFTTLPDWYLAAMGIAALAAQVALAAGTLGLARAYRLRGVPVITAADARVLNRRAAVGLVGGAIALTVMPLSYIRMGGYAYGWWMHPVVGIAFVVLMLLPLPAVLRASRLRPGREGAAGDLTADIGTDLSTRIHATPWRLALALSLVIVGVVTVIGIGTDDPYDGLLRGLLDAGACISGFALLGRYLGLRGNTTGLRTSATD